ncbi:inositol monophosphatase family protein [Paenisporosarcina sp. OV554]|uniref:inositol monophosphatase family protein n=1 Tax=Paenisporosarcina sp. OV554 TaxID=2135694 RepID=UPI000D373B3A|nr:inositol monophosphatase family protein [Paenisporosarcina sp. OV554]PUB18042.1 myo-inositol-1(or 4)-monophosphatase [Paenisporosarcina sp. OV554]
MELQKLDRYAKALIKEAGRKIRQSFSSKLAIESKADANDLVTNIDKEIEQFFIKHIRHDFEGHFILGEEGFGDRLTNLDGYVWMLDPIDGTMNFIHQQRNFAISLGIYKDGIGVLGYIYDVIHDELYSAQKGQGAYLNDEPIPLLESTTISEAIIGMNASWVVPNSYIENEGLVRLVKDVRGIRSYGSAALELAYVATGRIDAYMSMRLSPWDVAGGVVIAQEVGAVATNLNGQPLKLLGQDTFLVARKSLHDTLIEKYIILK